MNFEEALTPYIGQSVEIFLLNSFVQGTLLAAANGIITVDAVNSGYSSVTGIVNILIANIEYVRVLTV